MPAPTRYPDWAINAELSPAGAPNKVEVPTEFTLSGIKAGEPIPRAYYNENLNLLGLWVRHLEQRLNEVIVDPSSGILQMIFPVGSYWTTEGAQNPATHFGFGSWVKVEGRVIMGQKADDPDFDVPGEIGGVKSHSHGGVTGSTQLTTAQMPSHDHPYRDRYYIEAFNTLASATFKETAPLNYNNNLGSGDTDYDNQTFLYTNATTSTSGGGEAHNHSVSSASNLPPYVVANIWKRIA